MSRLWDRGEPLDRVVERFTVGRDAELDVRLAPFDALGSAAHARMLERIGILSHAEGAALAAGLAELVRDSRAGRFALAPGEEDCHTALENRLTARCGDAGKRIHTGRSRNDQVIAALRLFAREALLEISERLLETGELLADLAERHRETSVAGYTHTKQAMPSTLGHLFAAHAEGLLDALPWLWTAFGHVNRSPLGSASGYGVPMPLDRAFVAELLAFDRVQENTLAVQNDRGKTELLVLGTLLGPATDLGRLATDLIWFSSDELGYLRLGDAVTTGSSIMPQKRNPDVLELVRAQGARLRGLHLEVAGVLGGLASGYHRDLQLTKGPFLDGLQTVLDLLVAMRPVLTSLEVHPERCRAAMLRTTGATDVAYRRVAAGEPFRSVYAQIAAAPEKAVAGDPSELWRERKHLGAPGALDLADVRARLAEGRRALATRREPIAKAWVRLGLAPD